MEQRTHWKGTATDLLTELARVTPEHARRARGAHGWPSVANQLSARVWRAAPGLGRVGISVERVVRGHKNERLLVISRRLAENADRPLASLAPAVDAENSRNSEGLPASDTASGTSDAGAASSTAGHGHTASDARGPQESARDGAARGES
jgi:hypothetical protein